MFLFWSLSSYLGKLIFHVKGMLLWASPLPSNHLREGLKVPIKDKTYWGQLATTLKKKKMQHSLHLPVRFCLIRMKNSGENKVHSVEHDPFWAISNQFMNISSLYTPPYIICLHLCNSEHSIKDILTRVSF